MSIAQFVLTNVKYKLLMNIANFNNNNIVFKCRM